MDWNSFIFFGTVSALCWLTAGFLSLKVRRITAPLLISAAGTVFFLAFIIGFWITLERPPLRTLGETAALVQSFPSMTGAFLYALALPLDSSVQFNSGDSLCSGQPVRRKPQQGLMPAQSVVQPRVMVLPPLLC